MQIKNVILLSSLLGRSFLVSGKTHGIQHIFIFSFLCIMKKSTSNSVSQSHDWQVSSYSHIFPALKGPVIPQLLIKTPQT